MNRPLLFNLDSDPDLAERLAAALDADRGRLEQRHFPDGESYLRVVDDPAGRDALIFCNLVDPDARTLRLILLAETLRELGARRISLIAPYLAYMRQDRRFRSGEAVNARIYGALISRHVDFLVCVDPHLHRIHALEEVYSIPTRIVHSAPLVAELLRARDEPLLLIGPDSESAQWVNALAEATGMPALILAKERFGDRDVTVSAPELENWQGHRPVLFDDIISSGETMLAALAHLEGSGLPRPLCIGVHGLFADNAWERLSARAEVITTESVPHPSNRIRLDQALAEAIRPWLGA